MGNKIRGKIGFRFIDEIERADEEDVKEQIIIQLLIYLMD